MMCFYNNHTYSHSPSIHTFRLQRYACISSFFHAFLFITLSSSFTTDSTLVLSAPPPPSSLCLALFVVLNRDPVFISSASSSCGVQILRSLPDMLLLRLVQQMVEFIMMWLLLLRLRLWNEWIAVKLLLIRKAWRRIMTTTEEVVTWMILPWC